MKNSYLWTKSKARLQLIRTEGNQYYNWLFLPGGPGLGSESLNDLTKILHLPGTIWHVDLPGDGSNITTNDTVHFANWLEALTEVTSILNNVILVAHSTGGMFALATPALKKTLLGLVLMDSAPNASWQKNFTNYTKNHHLDKAKKFQKSYQRNPSNAALKKFTMACAPYLAIPKSLKKITTLLKSLPYNFKSYEWAAQHFDKTYKAKWIPKNIPCLILAGDQDHITPLKLFSKRKPPGFLLH